MPAVSFGMSLVMNCHKWGLEGGELGVFFLYPCGRINSGLVLNLTICHVLQIIESLQNPVGFSKSLCRRTAVCLCRTLDLGTLPRLLLLSQRVNNFLPLP